MYCNSPLGAETSASDVQAACDLFQATSRRSNSAFAAELNAKQASAMADLVLERMHTASSLLLSLPAGVYCNSPLGIEAFASDVQAACDLFQAASRRSAFAAELHAKQASATADLVSERMQKLMRQHHGLAEPDQAPTPVKKLKKGGSTETSPGSSSDPGSSQDKSSNIVEDLAR